MSEGGIVVSDTHAFIWHLEGDARLTESSRAVFREAEAGLRSIFIPSITIVETIYLAERDRVDRNTVDVMISAVTEPNRPYHVVALDLAVARALRDVPRDLIPDMPDRIITATARALGYPLISADGRLRAAGVVEVIWT